jgi:hypothetical protein
LGFDTADMLKPYIGRGLLYLADNPEAVIEKIHDILHA